MLWVCEVERNVNDKCAFFEEKKKKENNGAITLLEKKTFSL